MVAHLAVVAQLNASIVANSRFGDRRVPFLSAVIRYIQVCRVAVLTFFHCFPRESSQLVADGKKHSP